MHKYQLAYEVSCTANGAEVIELLKRNQYNRDNLPDIILLDIYMPAFDGWDFLDKAEKLYTQLSKPLKIYILSSSINPRDLQIAKQYACVCSFIFKPITKEVLEKLIGEETAGIS